MKNSSTKNASCWACSHAFCAGIVAYAIIVNRRRQPMGVMNFVFPITALYFGPLAVALYWRWGRTARATAPAMAASPAAMSMTSM
jgi:hypothetical protein